MKLVTAEQMRSLDRAAIDEFKIPSLGLMERAGTAVADLIAKHFSPSRGTISFIVGKGNNGGDGLVAARLLVERGYDTLVFLTSPASELSPDARANWERLALLTPTFFYLNDSGDLKSHSIAIARSVCIVDAIFGTGLALEIKDRYRDIIEFVNGLKIPVVSADIPSGLSSDTGMPLGCAIRARWTVTFGLPKIGLFTGKGTDYSGHVEIADIGLPEDAVDGIETKTHLIDTTLFSEYFRRRDPKSHKGTFGHVVIFAGSGGRLGAGYLSSMAALRSGCGLVTYVLPESCFARFDARYPEIMPVAIPDRDRGHFHPDGLAAALDLIKDKTIAAIGPAIGTHDETRAFVVELVKRSRLPMVIDADGLNVLAGTTGILSHRQAPTVLTPHPGEMERLTGKTKNDEERLQDAVLFATGHRVHLVLKGHRTIVAAPDGSAYINPTGSPAMASAGMGDALTGMIAGFMAQGMPATIAGIAGVYLHGLAGDMASRHFGERGVVASDLIKLIPEAMQSVLKS